VATSFDRTGRAAYSEPLRFVVDLTPPPTPAFERPQASAEVPETFDASGSAEPGSLVSVLADGAFAGARRADVSGVWSVALTLAEGAHSLTAFATDAAGNRGAASGARAVAVRIPAVPAPAIAEPRANATLGPRVDIAGTAPPGGFVTVFDGGARIASCTADARGAWWTAVSLAGGEHSLSAVASDGRTASPVSPAVAFVVDASPPDVTLASADASGTTGTASDGAAVARVEVEYRDLVTGVVSYALAACNGCGAAAATWRDDGPGAPGFYRASATAVDRAGNRSTVVWKQYLSI
jgi:hypothetical protein